MAAKKYYSILTLFLIIVLFANLTYVQSVRADGETPTEPPVATQAMTEPPVEATSAPVESTPIPEEATVAPVAETPETAANESGPAEIILPQELESTDIVVLDEQGQSIALSSQDAANALVTS